jgi:hypothetical protein
MLKSSGTSTLFVSQSAGSAVIAAESDITASSRFVSVSTDAQGRATTVTPSQYTSQLVTTSNGQVITRTVVVHNPTGALDAGGNGGSTNAFFDNTGAVAGTFVVVGLVVVGILFALGLLCFRRRRRQRLDREVTAAAVAASTAAQRSPLDEDNDVHSSSGPTSESYPSTGNHPMAQYAPYGATYGNAGGYDPYAAQGHQPYSDHPNQGPFDTPHGYDYGAGAAAGAGGYEGLQHGTQNGYYFNPAEAGQYDDALYGTGNGQGQGQGYDHGYSDPYGGYQGQADQGSLDTPTERENPLHVANPSRHQGY